MQKTDDRVQIHKIKEHAHKMCLNESTVCLLVLIVTSEHAGFFHVVSRQHFHCRAPEPDRDAKKNTRQMEQSTRRDLLTIFVYENGMETIGDEQM